MSADGRRSAVEKDAWSTPTWMSDGKTLRGTGEVSIFDPGSGRGRYLRALEWLRQGRHEVGFASFTFDPDEKGSLVLAPEGVSDASPRGEETKASRVTPIDDGVEAWRRGFSEVTTALAGGSVRKVVLARQVRLAIDLSGAIDDVLPRLVAPGAHVFSIAGLVGASPELLAAVNGDRVSSQALAGTASGVDGLEGPKTGLEHALAAESVRSGLEEVADQIETEVSTVEVGGLAHHATSFSARLKPRHGVMHVLAAVHPSAAVAGTPRDLAIEMIRRVEPSSRGRYAGPVGWFDREGNGQFALALRCATIQPGLVTLFAGGGLVAGSLQDDELAETGLKLTPMLRALRIELADEV